LREAVRSEPGTASFQLNLGRMLAATGRLDEAIAHLREAVRLQADNPAAHFNLGLVREEQGRVEAAVDSYRRELEVNPKGYRAAFNLAKLLQRAGRTSEAAALFAKVVSLAPDFAIGRLYLAKALLDSGNLEGAEREARQALGQRPDPRFAPLGHYVLADVFNRQGRFAAARVEQAAGDRLAAGTHALDPGVWGQSRSAAGRPARTHSSTSQLG
jgi:tetratricopeptide (TPR) repeat protein